MSKNGKRNSLLASSNRYNPSNTAKDELNSLKYQLNQPELIYPLDTKTKDQLTQERGKLSSDLTYPDFQPWKDHTQLPSPSAIEEEERMDNSMYLNKGLFEAPQVSNEYYSARNLIQTTIFSSSENCAEILKELSQHLASVYKTRNETINKINYESNNFKLPPKVTLTSSKRDAWIKELADPSVPLSKVATRLPHGIKNKILLDILCSNQVPNMRAIWFTKCVLYGDALLIRKKVQMKISQTPNFQGSDNLLENQEIQWLQEWTQQVIDYLYRFSREFNTISNAEKKQESMSKLNYLLKYIQTLYIENLIDKDLFLTLIIRFFKDGLLLDNNSIIQLIINSNAGFNDDDNDEITNNEEYEKLTKTLDLNYGQRLVALILVKIFWLDIIKLDYLSKDLAEVLLLNYYFIERSPVFNNKQPRSNIVIDHLLSAELKESILKQISRIIKSLFAMNSNIFIIPNYWILVGKVLYSILLGGKKDKEVKEIEGIQKQLQLISYRNESLMLSMKRGNPNTKEENNVLSPFTTGHRRTGSFPNTFTPFESTFNEPFLPPSANSVSTESTNLESIESEIFINRKNDDVLRIIDYLDKSNLNEELGNLIKPNVEEDSDNWKLNLSVVIMWCISKYRDPSKSNENILMVCGFIKNITKSDKSVAVKSILEDGILDTIFSYNDGLDEINLNSLFVLFNELYQLKTITISSYLRKLIASGIFYLPPGQPVESSLTNPQIDLHLQMLKNLPVLKNKQTENILKLWDFNGHFNANDLFDKGKEILNDEILEKFKFNNPITYDFDFFIDSPVGIKYLLVNWITDEIKSVISTSPKLIHIKLQGIIKLYEYYSISDNLTVFFRIIVKSLLKNESRIIVLDLDVLYILSRLTIKHFKLIKTLSNNETNFGYELFKLIFNNYKDLTKDEFDYFNFKDVWKFISKSIEVATPNKNTVIEKPEIKIPIPQFIFSKNTVDSPMKLNNTKDINADSNETIDGFLNEVNLFVNKPFNYLKTNEIIEILKDLKLSDQLINEPTNNKKILLILLDYCFKYYNKLNDKQEIQLIKLLVNTKNSLIDNEGNFAFFECLNFFTTKALGKVQHSEESEVLQGNEEIISKMTFTLMKMNKFEIIDFNLIYSIFQSCSNNLDIPVDYNDILLKLLIGEDSCLLLELNREVFMKTNTVFEVLGKVPVNSYNDKIIKFFSNLVFKKSRKLFDNLLKFSEPQIIEFLDKVSGLKIETFQDFFKDDLNIHEFNLPLYQMLIRLIIIKDFKFLTDEEKFNNLKNLVMKILDNLHVKFSLSNSFFGELFTLVPINEKITISKIIESILFKSLVFDGNKFTCERNGIDYLPVIYDYFKKFSVSSINIEINEEFFHNLLQYLNQLNYFSSDKVCQSFDYLLSIFLRILIIHKNSIVNYVLNDEANGLQFALNLKKLLECQQLQSPKMERLKILLYDLILIFKNLLLQHISKTPKDLTTDKVEVHDILPDFTKYEKLLSVFDLPDFFNNGDNTLHQYLDVTRIESSLMLTREELEKGGDYHRINNNNLILFNKSNDTFSPFNLLSENHPKTSSSKFKIKSFEILENTSTDLNNGRINLSLFDAYITKQNPP
ncbi:mediator of RNA polymerase II transcription subunit 12 [[Candida] jaroonii]|uniref:Mediator of RNA polymerase II transcription subunit 12 n=1 Tax=[Candida] jaroonii TaxID=467808 RepID=A0ACA9YD01_9ASCO|nr:mediator of RNA polymerase II transcription subunit 12 [[Candida] jaroonii]